MSAITAKVVHEFEGNVNGVTTTNEDLHLALIFLLESMEEIFKIKTFDKDFIEDLYSAIESEYYNSEALPRDFIETHLVYDMNKVEDEENPKQALSNLQFDELMFASVDYINEKLKDQDYNFTFKD